MQLNANSVQQTLNEALGTILRCSISVLGAGRTDTGVHAKEMFAHFDTEEKLDEDLLTAKLNRLLPPDIAVQRIIKVSDEAHARFDATARSYEYQITFAKNPFNKDLALRINYALNVNLMQQCAAKLIDYQDFSAFSKSNTQTFTNICTVKTAFFEITENGLIFHITANRFLRNMVRAIVGTLLKVGAEKISEADFIKIIESKDRKQAGESAPTHGLYLTRVEYPKQILNV